MAIQIADSKQPFLLSQFLPRQTDSQSVRVTVEELEILFENDKYPTFFKKNFSFGIYNMSICLLSNLFLSCLSSISIQTIISRFLHILNI